MMMEMMETWKSYYEQLENNDGTDGNWYFHIFSME